jgi:pimeloyl-ACP methyl ester carboxylesterase
VHTRTKIKRVAKLTLLSLSATIVLLVGGCFAYRTYRHAALAKATLIDPIKGIDEAFFTRIGGVDQWITIRGQDRKNPVILLVHGGPGIALSPMPRDFLWSWSKQFTLVLWDQRGAGKTFGRSGPVSADVTIDRMAGDGIELAQFIRGHLNKQKIILVGVSWGSDLGVRMVKSRPDLFYAYVGTGQSVNQGKFRAVAYAQLLDEARTRHDQKAIKELEANGPPPYDSIAKATVHTKWANAYEPGQPSTANLLSIVLFDSDAGIVDLRNYMRGIASSQDHFRDAVEREDLASLGTEFAVPVFVFQGASDNVTPGTPVRQYFDSITAPHKELVMIQNAGHNVVATKSDEFLSLLVQRVRPLALDLPQALQHQ